MTIESLTAGIEEEKGNSLSTKWQIQHNFRLETLKIWNKKLVLDKLLAYQITTFDWRQAQFEEMTNQMAENILISLFGESYLTYDI